MAGTRGVRISSAQRDAGGSGGACRMETAGRPLGGLAPGSGKARRSGLAATLNRTVALLSHDSSLACRELRED